MLHKNEQGSRQLAWNGAHNIQTIYYQGIISSQTQITKYMGSRPIPATTGQVMYCKGRNNLAPPDLLIDPFIGPEIKDVNLEPYHDFTSYFNPLTITTSSISRFINWYYGIRTDDPAAGVKNDVKANSLNISKISIGQETDIESHLDKYNHWKEAYPNNDLILWGVSRGAATTFNAYAKYKYPEVKLVILEGCFYSFEDVLASWTFHPISPFLHAGLNFFTNYQAKGPSPEQNIEHFPENVPVIFISSKIDKVVPYSSTEKLARELAGRKKNDVYLLELERSSHPSYMFDDAEDRNRYESFIHAIYKKYNLPHIPELAEKGAAIMEKSFFSEEKLSSLPSPKKSN